MALHTANTIVLGARYFSDKKQHTPYGSYEYAMSKPFSYNYSWASVFDYPDYYTAIKALWDDSENIF